MDEPRADLPPADESRLLEPLNSAAVRVLGALVEKEFTTPDNYPLSLNALLAACNQTSNRDPVLELDEATVRGAIAELDRRKLAKEVFRSDSRVRRYRHALSDTLHLHPAELATMCVLMLRGPQTAGEIRTRTARMFEFNELALVDITLQALITLSTPLATQLPRRPGQKEVRYAHLLSGEPGVDAEPDAASAPATSRVAAAAATARVDELEQTVAELRTEMAELREMFDAFRRQFE